MKGLVERTESGTKFLVVKHHTLCEESKIPREGFEPVEVRNPQNNEVSIKYIKKYKGVEAMVKKIEWRDTEDRYDQRYMSWRIHLDAAGTPCILELPFESRASSRFMKVAELIDWDKPVEFRAWKDANSDGTAFFIGQDEVSVPQKYTKDNPGDCPEPVKRFGDKWNFDDQMEFLHKRMVEVVIPRVALATHAQEVAKKEQPLDNQSPEYDEEDDVKF